MLKRIPIFIIVLLFSGVPAKSETVAIVPGGEPKPNELLVLTEAKLFTTPFEEGKEVALLERTEVDKVLAEQRLSGMFGGDDAIKLGQILKADMFAVLETTSIVIFDAKTGLRFVDETLPEKIEEATQVAFDAVKTAAEKYKKFDQENLVTFGILEVRNVDFSTSRDGWCRAVASMLERSLLLRGGAVLERSRLQHVNRERQLTGDDSNDLLASMKLIDLAFTRGETAESFKLTARIGKEAFHAEGRFDKPLDVVHKLAEQLLESKIEIRQVNEAARFMEEANFFLRLAPAFAMYDSTHRKELVNALEKIEVAVALEPENLKYKEMLVTLLCKLHVGHFVPDPEGEGYYRLKYKQVDAETMRQLVRIFWRIDELIASFPPNHRRVNDHADGTGYLKNMIMMADEYHPEYKAELEMLFQQRSKRNLDRWVNENYRPALEKIVDLESYRQNIRCIMDLTPGGIPNLHADNISLNVEMVENALRLSQKYGLQGENPLEINETRFFFELLERFAGIAREARLNNLAKTDPRSAELIERVLVMMEQDTRAKPKIYAWLARNIDAYLDGRLSESNTISKEKKDEYFMKIESFFSSLPKGMTFSDCFILYKKLHWLVDSYEYRHETLQENIGCPPWLKQLTEILELADSRDEFAFHAVGPYLSTVSRFHAEKIENPEFLKLRKQFDPIVRRQIALGERVSPGGYFDKEILYFKNSAMKVGILEAPETPELVLQRPWKSEVTLLPISDGYRKGNPIIRGNKLFCVLEDFDERFKWTLGAVNLETLEKRYIPFPEDTWLHHICKDNAYFIHHSESGKGLGFYVYPHNGSEPWRVSIEELPGTSILPFGTLDNKYYVAVDEDWIYRLDLETRQWEQLSSSRAKDGKTPFIDGLRLRKFEAFYDISRERIVFCDCSMDEAYVQRGVWTIEKDGSFVQIDIRLGSPVWYAEDSPVVEESIRKGLPVRYEKNWKSEYRARIMRNMSVSVSNPIGIFNDVKLLFHNNQTLFTYDFETAEVLSIYGPIVHGWGSDKACCLWKGFLWWGAGIEKVGLKWQRLPIIPFERDWDEGPSLVETRNIWESMVEPLAIPDAITAALSVDTFNGGEIRWWKPTFCAPTPDGKNLIVGGNGEIVLLLFE